MSVSASVYPLTTLPFDWKWFGADLAVPALAFNRAAGLAEAQRLEHGPVYGLQLGR